MSGLGTSGSPRGWRKPEERPDDASPRGEGSSNTTGGGRTSTATECAQQPSVGIGERRGRADPALGPNRPGGQESVETGLLSIDSLLQLVDSSAFTPQVGAGLRKLFSEVVAFPLCSHLKLHASCIESSLGACSVVFILNPPAFDNSPGL